MYMQTRRCLHLGSTTPCVLQGTVLCSVAFWCLQVFVVDGMSYESKFMDHGKQIELGPETDDELDRCSLLMNKKKVRTCMCVCVCVCQCVCV